MRDLRRFTIYIAIGSLVFALDTGTFALLMRAHMVLAVAATLSYMFGIGAHFSLNRVLNFRNFERSMHGQIKTYLVVAGFCYLVSLGVIEAGFRLFHLTPIAAKMLSIVLNIPIGYMGHRCFTFSGGIRASLRRFRAQAMEKRVA